METLSGSGVAVWPFRFSSSASTTSTQFFFPSARQALFFPVWPRLPLCPKRIFSHTRHAKKRNSSFEAVLKQSATTEVEQGEQVVMDDDEEEDDDLMDELEDEMLVDEDVNFEEDFEMEDMEPHVGDGAAGGGISLAGTWWDKEALAIVEDVSKSFGGDLKIYAFKTYANSVLRVRIEKLSSMVLPV